MKNKSIFQAAIVLGVILSLGPLWAILYQTHFLPDMSDSSVKQRPQAAHALIALSIGNVLCIAGVTLLVTSLIRLDQSRKPTPPPLPPST